MAPFPASFIVLFSWLAFLTVTPVCLVHGADQFNYSQTISDSSGNTADNSSTITWADLPAGDDFLVSSPSRVSEGLTAYYDLMHSFISSVFIKGIPDEIIEKGIEGDFGTITSNYQSYINYFIGFGICVATGVLFFLIFPLIACCFCCCRLCGNCGGKRQQVLKDAENGCRKYTFVGILFVSIIFAFVGTICIYINNENMTTTLNNIPETAENNINDVKTFVNNTVKQATHIVTNNFEFVQKALYRDLDNIEYLVGLPLKNDIKENSNISNVLSTAYGLSHSLDSADAALSAVESNKTAMETAVNDLSTALAAVKAGLDDIFNNCSNCSTTNRPNYAGATADNDTSAFPDLSSARTNLDNAKAENLTQKINKAEAEVDDIPARVGKDSNSSREDMKTKISNFAGDLADIVNEITDVNDKLSGEGATVDLDKYITKIRDFKELIETYDKYRWYGGVGLSSICLIAVVLTLFGLAFGIFGGSIKTPPQDRGCVSNCGGIMLMVAASLIFIFSAWLMLLTFVTFIPGAPMHKIVCEPITDLDKLEEYVTIYNDQKVGAGNYFLADILLNNKTIPLTLTGVLRDCKDGKGAFTAFKLDNKFDLDDMLNYSKTLDVQAEIDAINLNLSTVDIYSADLKTQLADVKNAVNISFAKFYAELGSNVTNASLSSLADEIDTYANKSTLPPNITTQLKQQAEELRRIENEEFVFVENNKTALNTSVAAMDDVMSNILAQVDKLDIALRNADNYVQNNGSASARSILKTYVARLLSIVDSYVNYTDDAVKNKLGSCEPIWNVYNTLLVYTFCYNFLDSFNGFWFSLGWVIFFFMPSLIFSVKLAKYFRRMNAQDSMLVDSEPPPYSKDPNRLAEHTKMPSKAKLWMKKNKVTHRDTIDSW